MRSLKTFQFFKLFAVLGAVLILACCAMMYLMLDPTLFPKGRSEKLSIEDVSIKMRSQETADIDFLM